MMENFNHKKKTGILHFFAAGGYSAEGLRRVWKESAFRQEIGGGIILAVIYALIGIDAINALIAIIVFVILLAVEAINTAIEEVVDRISPEFSLTAKHAKNLGSFAVSCLICANVFVFVYALHRAGCLPFFLAE